MKTIYKPLLFAAAALLSGGCSDSGDWKPGPEESPSMGVYFGEQSTYDLLILDEADRHFTVNISRNETSEAAAVPLKVISSPEGVTVPPTVNFEAGEETTSFEIDFKDIPDSTKGEVVIGIDPAYSSLYAAGSSEMVLKVTVSAGWILLADDLVINHSFTQNLYQFPKQTTSLYVLDGVNKFKITDFMHSGLDFVFTVARTDGAKSYIVPTTNCVFYKDLYESDDYNSWYFYDTANAIYPVWSIDGSDIMVEYMTIDSYQDGDEDDPDTYITMNDGKGMISAYMEYSNGKSSYHWASLKFTTKFNPFGK